MFSLLLALRGAISGVKTYITVGLWFLCLALEKGFGIDVQGFEPGPDWLEQSFTMILVATGRSAVGKLSSGAVLERILERVGKE